MNLLNSAYIGDGSVEGSEDDFSEFGIGIVHFGPGAFHRAHLAVYTHDALKHQKGDWRILGVGLRSTEIVDALHAQECMYSVSTRSADGGLAPRIVKSIAQAKAAARDKEGVLTRLANPATRIVSMTVTEKAYGILRETGRVDRAHESIAKDIADPRNPTGILGVIVEGLWRRRQAGLRPFTVLCCDNLPQNGELIKAGILDFARQIDETDLAAWIAEEGAFPNSMVDRITPAATESFRQEIAVRLDVRDEAAIETEPFSQWVIEDRFAEGRPAWDAAGVVFVKDVAPYEEMKLRMLNGAHSLIAYMGFLLGKTYVRDVMADVQLSTIVDRHIKAASQTLSPFQDFDLDEYGQKLIERFANPNIAHETYQIAMDGSQKMPQRIFAPALESLKNNLPIAPFALATAVWIRYCSGTHENGEQYDLRDPRSQQLAAAFISNGRDPAGICQAFHELPDLFPAELTTSKEWRLTVCSYLGSMLERGLSQTVSAYVDTIEDSA
ncbi:MAG: mannitol dehydrogenase family protein [Rhizobiaceae bacterium]|nr:mannitol dehydrogenase family protein [Rhizobiaceae bacterium]